MDSPPRTGPRARRRAGPHVLLIAVVAAWAVAAPGVPTGEDPRADAAADTRHGRAPRGLVLHREVRYGSAQSAVLDVYRADGRERAAAPGVLVVHGGGWRSGDKRKMAVAARALARAGLVAFNVNYSLATTARAGFPTQLRELRGALRWVRRHGPRYGVDPRRLGALGSLAGAHLVALLGVTGTAASPAVPRLRAVVSWSAPLDLSAADAPALAPAIATFLGCASDICPAGAAASPLTHVTGDDPPMLLVASEGEFVPIEQARSMATSFPARRFPPRRQ